MFFALWTSCNLLKTLKSRLIATCIFIYLFSAWKRLSTPHELIDTLTTMCLHCHHKHEKKTDLNDWWYLVVRFVFALHRSIFHKFNTFPFFHFILFWLSSSKFIISDVITFEIDKIFTLDIFKKRKRKMAENE